MSEQKKQFKAGEWWFLGEAKSPSRVLVIRSGGIYPVQFTDWDGKRFDEFGAWENDTTDCQFATPEQCDAAGVPNTPEHRPCEEQRTVAWRYGKLKSSLRTYRFSNTRQPQFFVCGEWSDSIDFRSADAFLAASGFTETDAFGKPLAPPDPVKPPYTADTLPGPVTWVRSIGSTGRLRQIVGMSSDGVRVSDDSYLTLIGWRALKEHYEISTDRVSWQPGYRTEGGAK